MSPVIGLVLLLASGYVSSLAAAEHNPHYRLREHGTYKEIRKSGKPGTCPADVDYPTCNPLVINKPACRKDRDCDGTKKCCYSGCTNRCLLPLQDKLNPCPCFNHSICIRVRPLPAECHNDGQCQGSDRCCCNDCRRECTPTVRVKPGQCPAPKKNIIAKPCRKDSDCHGTKKCCGLKCVTPEEVKPGSCPVPNTSCLPLEDDEPLCTCDEDCPGAEKCCIPKCRQECTNPVTVIPERQCPVVNTFVKCGKPDPQPECDSDSQCRTGQKCCNFGCIFVCTEV